MDVLFALCAESATIDGATNRLSLFNIAEEIQGVGFPGVISSLAFVMLLARKKSEPENYSLRIIGNSGSKIIFDAPFNGSFDDKLRTRVVANLQGVPILGPGELTISAFKNNKRIAAWPILIQNVEEPRLVAAGGSAMSATAFGTGAFPGAKTAPTKKAAKKKMAKRKR